MFKWFFPSLPKLPNLKLIVYLPKMFSPAGVPSWSCCPAHCWHSTELRTTHKWPVYWPQVRYTHEHTETHLTMGYEVSREPAVNRRTRPNATDQLHMRSWVSKLLVFLWRWGAEKLGCNLPLIFLSRCNFKSFPGLTKLLPMVTPGANPPNPNPKSQAHTPNQ